MYAIEVIIVHVKGDTYSRPARLLTPRAGKGWNLSEFLAFLRGVAPIR